MVQLPAMDQDKNTFQCFVHELRNETDWVNLKRSFVRAPQILKQKFKSAETASADEEFDRAHYAFGVAESQLHVLDKELLTWVYQWKQMMDHSIGLCDALAKLFDPNMDSRAESAPIKEGYQRFSASARFSKKFQDIRFKSIPNLELVLNNTREPVSKVLAIAKTIKRGIREREFALLDMNKYKSHLESLKLKEKETLTLKQEQNIIRYEKHLELSRLKFEQINNIYKKELPKFSKLVSEIVVNVFTVFYYLQITIQYQMQELNEATDDHFKLRTRELEMNGDSFAAHIVELNRKQFKSAKEKVESLNITKSSLETCLNVHLDGLSFSNSEEMTSIRTEFQYCTANYSFEGEQDGDLSFRKGDRIKILDQKTLSGDWWRGELNGNIGIFPKNYVII